MDDYDVIVEGTAAILRRHPELVEVVETDTDDHVDHAIDVALLDCFGRAEVHHNIVEVLAANPRVGHVAVYSWNFSPELVDLAFELGASAYLTKGLSGSDLANALVAIRSGERVVSHPPAGAGRPEVGRRWPGRERGLTERESEVLALIAQGKRPAEIAEALYLSINSIKTHTRNLYRKIGVTSRTEAALWGVDHGFRPDRSSGDHWNQSG
ncbi:MAG TPA: response regulator transcription factor [Acidimicrobiales bacterium]